MKLDTKGIIGQSSTLNELFKVLVKVAPTDSTVLVAGESGTGKELIVRALHANSVRADKPFVPINCGAIPKDLLESELFGHEKGAFTSAVRSRPGRFELANGGTIFLDEIGEMDLLLQVKILRVLQEKEIERVGGTEIRKVDVRIVAATNRDLEREVAAGRFREDLFYRLNVIPLSLPPLRERGGDILLLAEHFLEHFCKKKNRPLLRLSSDVKKALNAYHWAGNVRELENFMERISILCDDDVVQLKDLPQKLLNEVGDVSLLSMPQPLEPVCEVVKEQKVSHNEERNFFKAVFSEEKSEFSWATVDDLKKLGIGLKEFLEISEERLLNEALTMADGVKNQAAEILGIKRTTLIEKLKKKTNESI